MSCRFIELLQITFSPAEPNTEYVVLLKHKHGMEEQIKGALSGDTVTFVHTTYVNILFVHISLAQTGPSYIQLDTDENKLQISSKRRKRKPVTTEEAPLTLELDVETPHKYPLPFSERHPSLLLI